MPQHNHDLARRQFLTRLLAGAALWQTASFASQATAADATPDVFVERPAEDKPHQGKVLLAVQAHSDDIPLMAAGTVAKLVKEGYTGYLVRATNDDMGDAPGLGTAGSIGDHVLGNERDNAEVARALGLKKVFDLNYPNHRMGDVSQNELQCRLIFLIRLLKVDTVVCWDPWAHDEENPDHYQIARGLEAACWMAGRAHDYPEQFAAGLQPQAVREKYYFARRPETNRVVDVSGVIDQIIDANRANRAKGPAGTHGSQLRAKLAKEGKKLPLLGSDDATADRNYIRQFVLARSRTLGEKYGVEFAEAFHYIGGATGQRSPIEEYVEKNAVPIK
ncbi:MAG TPA: PIG-L family deacetylase [Pirellulales bacterium]|jgi:LmbE family N-acetylglucosaminyl deacetylase|nr:PIG-L family deacetylase [Pirellulales bacterium]